ncbi:MAG: hypothetical protein PSV16_04770 [Flavobacterium sp.]|nr:hypothetical protein [Flavobacterium sp.]
MSFLQIRRSLAANVPAPDVVAAWETSFLHLEKAKLGKRNEQLTEHQRLRLTRVVGCPFVV